MTHQRLNYDLHSIDIVENLAKRHNWNFDRIDDEQISIRIGGKWNIYTITISSYRGDEKLRLICPFEIQAPKEKLPALYETLNLANDKCWDGAFTYWNTRSLIVWRYALTLAGGEIAGQEQIETMVDDAVRACERFYPAFGLIVWGDRTPEEAMGAAMAKAYGRA